MMVKSELHLLRVLFRNYICCAFYLGFCVRNLIELGGTTTEGDFRSVVILIVRQCIFLPLPRGVIYGFNVSYHVYLVFLCPFFLFRLMTFVGYLVSTTTFWNWRRSSVAQNHARQSCNKGKSVVNQPSSFWKSEPTHEVRRFRWRACRNSLATKENLVRRKCGSSKVCPVCYKFDESRTSALWLPLGTCSLVWIRAANEPSDLRARAKWSSACSKKTHLVKGDSARSKRLV